MQRTRIWGWLAAVGVLAICSSASASIVVGGSTLLTQAYADQLESWLGEGPIAITRIFAKQAGDDALDFHAAVDGKGRTFSVLQVLANSTINGFNGQPTNNPAQIVGGYNPQSWRNDSTYTLTSNDADRTAFLFNLTSDEIQRQSLTAETGSIGQLQTYNYAGYGPTFGGGHDIFVHSNLTNGYAYNYSYGGTVGANNILSGPLAYQYGNMFGAIEVFTIAAAPDIAAAPEPAQLVVWTALTALSACGVVLRRQLRQQSGDVGR